MSSTVSAVPCARDRTCCAYEKFKYNEFTWRLLVKYNTCIHFEPWGGYPPRCGFTSADTRHVTPLCRVTTNGPPRGYMYHNYLVVIAPSMDSALRVAWLGEEQAGCRHDDVHYYCQQFLSLGAQAKVQPVPRRVAAASRATASFRAAADVLLVPPTCSMLPSSLASCLAHIGPGDPPVAVMLNKVFEGLDGKMAALRNFSLRHRLLLVTVPAPHTERYEVAIGVRVRFLPYAAADAFFDTKPYSVTRYGAAGGYEIDLGFTGGAGRYDERYNLRSQTMGDTALIRRLRASGLRVHDSQTVPTAQYVQLLGSSRVWFATTERGDHASPRYFEVLASGRAMLFCDRNARAYAPLGIVEGVHVATFNSSAEFETKLAYYLHHDGARRALVHAARRLALDRQYRQRQTEPYAASCRQGSLRVGPPLSMCNPPRVSSWAKRSAELAHMLRQALRASRSDGRLDEVKSATSRWREAHAGAPRVPGQRGGDSCPFDGTCTAAFVFPRAGSLGQECRTQCDRWRPDPTRFRANCVGIVGVQMAPGGSVAAALRSLCLSPATPDASHTASVRLRLLALLIQHDAPTDRASWGSAAPPPALAVGHLRAVRPGPVVGHPTVESVAAPESALPLLARDGVVHVGQVRTPPPRRDPTPAPSSLSLRHAPTAIILA